MPRIALVGRCGIEGGGEEVGRRGVGLEMEMGIYGTGMLLTSPLEYDSGHPMIR